MTDAGIVQKEEAALGRSRGARVERTPDFAIALLPDCKAAASRRQ